MDEICWAFLPCSWTNYFLGVWNFENVLFFFVQYECFSLKSSRIIFSQRKKRNQGNLVAFARQWVLSPSPYRSSHQHYELHNLIDHCLCSALYVLCRLQPSTYQLTAAEAAEAVTVWQTTNHRKLTSIHQFDRYCVIDCFQFFANGHYYNKMARHTTIVR